jgi:hypothetical protein
VDYLFCLDKEQNMFVIPVEDIKANGNIKQITLKTEVSKFANSTTLQTAQYLVKF